MFFEVSSVEKNLEISNLLDFYADLLTDNQRQVLSLYYDEDFSLAEIAENQGITRQGVRDTIKKAELQLFELEKKLQLSQKFESIQKKLQIIIENSEKLFYLQNNDKDEINVIAKKIKDVAKSIYKEQ